MTSLYWIALAIAICVLTIAAWNSFIDPRIKAVTTVIATGTFALAYTGSALALALIGADALLVVATWRLAYSSHLRSWKGSLWIVFLIACLVVSRITVLQPVVGPTIWLGISYQTFRLIHVTLDARRNRLGQISLSELMTYTLHPATLLAGPIDRAQHSAEEQHRKERTISRYATDGLWRIFTGLFKKITIANMLFAYVEANPIQNLLTNGARQFRTNTQFGPGKMHVTARTQRWTS